MSIEDSQKVVIVVSSSLGIGLAANRAAVIATGLAKHIPNMIGPDVTTKDGVSILGITQIPIPILAARADTSFIEIAKKADKLGCKIVVFLTRVQGMRSYNEYTKLVADTNYDDLDIDAIGIFGDPKAVTKLTGNLPSLR
jgi:hypothetical protein